MAKEVVLLTQWFDPEPTIKGMAFARELVKQGFEVEVITGFPNYPGGKIYAGYRVRLIQRELIDGVKITRLPLYPSHDHSAIRRIFNYGTFAISALFYGLFVLKRSDLIYAYHPPITVGIVASLIRVFRRIPVVLDIQDIWPDTLESTGMIKSSCILTLISGVCSWVYRKVDHVVVLSPGFKLLLNKRGVPREKIDVIYNWADEGSLVSSAGLLPQNFPGDGAFKIVFAGNMGRAQDLDVVIEAATLLQEANSRVVFIMVGGGLDVARLKAETNRLQLSNIVFFSQRPMTQIGAILFAADALLVHLKKDPLFKVTIPSKTQAYMCVGKPVLMAVDGDAAKLVEQSNGGVIVESGNPSELARASEYLAALDRVQLVKMAEASRQYYLQNLSLEAGVRKFTEIFSQF
jgi:colanic acid biosynthesis glycosyl transferase WcaI